MRVNKRALVAACGLAAVTVAVFVALERHFNSEPSEVVGAAVKTFPHERMVSSAPISRQATVGFDLRSLRRIESTKAHTASLLAPRSWYVPPPPPPVPKVAVSAAPPPPPSPPQMPFTYIGKMIDGKRVLIFLLKGNVQYIAQLNDVLEGTYRIDKIADNDVVLTYIPMNAQQTLELRPAAAGGETSAALASGAPSAPPQAVLQSAPQRNLTSFVTQ